MEPFIAEIRIMPYSFAPDGWAMCEGQLLRIAQHNALFSIIGMQFGGDGRDTFGLPDLRGAVPIGRGAAPGLTNRNLGEKGGAATVTLTEREMPAHTHTLLLSSSAPNSLRPGGKVPGAAKLYAPLTNPVAVAEQVIGVAGQGMPHNNMQPYLSLNYCIALRGVFPMRPR
ncbi:MAG: phage tail protein [Acidobacteria bacterium]|nr:phage tail protein [Acidobacteriota bacterium]MBV9476746.1 phage tail protein [Acidobacteriota bacterium]